MKSSSFLSIHTMWILSFCTCPLMGRMRLIVPTMGYRLPPYWNAPFEGKIDPFLIRNFDPCYNPYTWTGPKACQHQPRHLSNWNKETPPPEGKRSLSRIVSTEQLCKKPFYMDINSVCNRDYRCDKNGSFVWDKKKKHYVCTESAMRTFQKNKANQYAYSKDVSRMFCHS